MDSAENLYLEVGTDCNAVGSATWELGDEHIICNIYGPDEAKTREELSHRAVIGVSVSYQSNNVGAKEVQLERYLDTLIGRWVDIKALPHTKITVKVHIVSGSPSRASTVASIVNCISLALLYSSLPTHASLSAVCVTSIGVPIAVVVDTSRSIFRQLESSGTSGDVIYSLFLDQDQKDSKICPIELQRFLSEFGHVDTVAADVLKYREKLCSFSTAMLSKLRCEA